MQMRNNRGLRWGHCLSVCLCMLALTAGTALADPMDQDIFDNFETINTSIGESFDLGAAPNRATFSGEAFSGVAGIGELYHSGSHAWMVSPNHTGFIDFETNAAMVEFYARTRSLATSSTFITALDDGGTIVGSAVELTANDGWQLISFAGNIDRILVENFDGTHMNSVDDFGYTPVPEPASLVLLMMIAPLAWFVRRCRTHRV